MIGKRIAVWLAGLGAIVLISALSAWTAPLAGVGGPGHTVLLAPRTASSGCKRGPSPDRRCSPGAYLSGLTKQVLCSPAFRGSDVRPVPESASFAVEREYGIKPARYGRAVVIDRVVPFVLGGSNDIANLFPEKLTGPAGYLVKDRLEARLRSMVCSRKITLRAAQVGIAKNWQALYQKVFGKSTAPPIATPGNRYPLHTGVVATTFWVGEIFNASIADGSQVCSTYDSEWAFHWSGGVSLGSDPSTDCSGAPIGGCDGQPSGSGASFRCVTEARSAANGYFPKNATVHPAENPFYLDLPFDDVNDSMAFRERCRVIPWAAGSSQCSNRDYSFMKNHWVAITGPSGNTCYGQIEDAGPSHGSLYHDARYVFGSANTQPVQGQFNNAGMDVSPALNGCLGFKELDGDSDKVSWRFVDAPPAGPWTKIVTKRQVS